MQAHIGKIEYTSDSHWRGGLAAAIYFAGCDFHCPNCNTPDILETKEEFIRELREIKTELKQYRESIKAVVFTGGEPCFQRQALLTLASFAKDQGLKVGIETNGSKTDTLRSLLRLGFVDMVALDMKAPFDELVFEKATRSKTFFKTTDELISDLKSSIKILEKHQDDVDIEIRTTITPGYLSRKEDLFKISDTIGEMRCMWVISPFDPVSVKNKMLKKVMPPSESFLADLRDALQKRYPNLRVMIE